MALAKPESEPAERISMAELQRLMRDPSMPESELKQYFTADPNASRPFAPGIIPDPARVEVDPPSDALEAAMLTSWANGLSRLRRQEKFRARVTSGDTRSVLVSEGDSWFQFPIFLEDVIDQLGGEFNIWSVDAAGDTLQNMVIDDAEYMHALREQDPAVRAFLFSGGGNDIVGEQRDLGKGHAAPHHRHGGACDRLAGFVHDPQPRGGIAHDACGQPPSASTQVRI